MLGHFCMEFGVTIRETYQYWSPGWLKYRHWYLFYGDPLIYQKVKKKKSKGLQATCGPGVSHPCFRLTVHNRAWLCVSIVTQRMEGYKWKHPHTKTEWNGKKWCFRVLDAECLMLGGMSLVDRWRPSAHHLCMRSSPPFQTAAYSPLLSYRLRALLLRSLQLSRAHARLFLHSPSFTLTL